MSENSKLVRAVIWVQDYWLQLLAVLFSTVLPMLIGVCYEKENSIWFGKRLGDIGPILLFITVLGNLIIGIFSFREERRISILNKAITSDREKIQHYENDLEEQTGMIIQLFNLQLAMIFHKLRFTANERVSIYKHLDDKFVIFGRYSENQTFNSIRDKTYAQNEGFFGSVWNSTNGELYIDGLPAYFEQTKEDYYEAVRAHCDISKKRLWPIRMKCRNYYLKVIKDGHEHDRTAIMVFESLNPGVIQKSEIDDLLIEEKKRLRISMEKIMKLIDNDSSFAKRAGF